MERVRVHARYGRGAGGGCGTLKTAERNEGYAPVAELQAAAAFGSFTLTINGTFIDTRISFKNETIQVVLKIGILLPNEQ